MRAMTITILAATVFGCASSPRPFDGTLGYQTKAKPEGLEVTVVDEARHSRQATLEQVAQVCTDNSGEAVAIAQLQVLEESIYDDDLYLTVPVPVEVTNLGAPSKFNGQAQPIVHQEQVLQRVTLRKVVALCPGYA